jgi:iron-sulfur cluster insertion protein
MDLVLMMSIKTMTLRWLKDGVTVVIDGMSYQYLVGATVDYSESLTGSQFVVENPNASSTCGCGASFSL